MADSEVSSGAWRRIESDVNHRYLLLANAAKELESYKGIDDVSRLRLAAADVFVEKAQYRLTVRARWFLLGGAASALASGSILVMAALMIYNTSPAALIGEMELTGHLLTLLLVRAISFGGFVLGASYFLASLAVAFFHEGTTLYKSRHALRFGRLALYLTLGQVTINELQRIFRWNEEFLSAFKNIRAESMKDMGLGKASGMPVEIIKAVERLSRGNRRAAGSKKSRSGGGEKPIEA